jgi:hypothetical protein
MHNTFLFEQLHVIKIMWGRIVVLGVGNEDFLLRLEKSGQSREDDEGKDIGEKRRGIALFERRR